MRIVVAKTAGFCMGVRRAVELALDAPGSHPGPIYTYGPLIHNPQVLDLLAEKGIRVLTRIPEQGDGTVLIRAHGVPPDVKKRLRAAGFGVIEATCPRVIKVQTIIARHAKEGYASIIIGDRDHPEVVGLLAFAGPLGHVVDRVEDLDRLPPFDRAIIVAQTTQNTRFYQKVKHWAAAHAPHYTIFDTICDSTGRRQEEVKRMAESVDALVVVGGRSSGNTQRLAEIGRESGKPTFHVETDTEIDPEALAPYQTVGVTAGASTPNWIINRVCRVLETLPYRKTRSWLSRLFRIQRVLLLTNIYVSVGAACLCYACSLLQGVTQYPPYVLIAFLYVQSMHILNNLTGIREDMYNDPERASFYNNHKVMVSLLAILAGGAGLITALAMGVFPFLVLFAMSVMGLSYNLRAIPAGIGAGYRRLKDVPGSKTVLIALAWGIVTTVFPPLSETGTVTPTNLLVFTAATLLVFSRTAFFDVLDMQGDRIVGKGTIPILLGEARTLGLLKVMLAAAAGVLALLSIFDLAGGLGYLLAICPMFMLVLLTAHQRGAVVPGFRLQFLVDTHFVAAGAMALIWNLAA